MNRSRFQTKQVTFLVLVSILLIVLDGRFQLLNGVHGVSDRLATPLRLSAAWPATVFENISDYFVDKTQLLKQNASLQQALLAKQVELQQVMRLQNANQALQALLHLPQTTASTVIITTLVNAAGYPYVQQLFVHHDAAVTVGSPVVTAEGVVGQVVASDGLIDTVLPLVDSKSDIPVQTEDRSLRAIAQGDGRNGLIIQQVAKSATLKIGEEFVTSGLGGVYPAGYAVGKIVDIVPSDDHVFLTLRLKPSVTVTSLDYVAVLTQGKHDA